MNTPTTYQLSLNNVLYKDVNSQLTENTYPDMLPDDLAISNSLFNLFNCPIASRGRIFSPEYGSLWEQYLQEPIDAITANSMWVSMIQSITKWEPRIKLNYGQTTIIPDLSIPGYQVRISGINPISNQSISIGFTSTKSQ
jgi:phage baseplate assembly protein W